MAGLTPMEKYEAYKYSGEDWISDIPEHWEVRKLKHLFVEKKHTRNMELSCGSISFGKVVTKDDDKIPLLTKASYQEVLAGEFLINPLNLNYDLISLRIGLSDINVVVSAGYIVLKNRLNICKEYFKYLLHRYDVAYMKLLGSGVRQTINFNHIANSLLIEPPLAEQTAIANFLDKKTAQIDEAIAIKEKQIELLKERKQIIIQQAVTRGLNLNVPMKDSGVDWIGEIPEHWEVKKLKFLIDTLESGVSVNASEAEAANEMEVGVLKTSAVYRYEFDPDENKKVFEDEIKRVSCPVKAGSIIISRMNAPELVGASGFVKKNYNNLYLPDRLWQAIFNLKYKNYALLVSYIMVTKGFRGVIESIATGSSPSMKNISKGDLLNIEVPIMPYAESKALIDHIENKSQLIKDSIKHLIEQIEKLKEYKTTLINSAVTGKIKVPEVA
ncbi:restriction endonuclease subunit S [Pseudoalteromonas sp. YIC-827]|uniref:Restriction endonuclease subunit S n=1 Tax=Pseudoalteromonas qingdaonensis TaxID=3131913 RepID=A0ABU9MUS4_9GAMM